MAALAVAASAAAYPGRWLREAACIHRHESVDWHIVNPPYEGGFQFSAWAWRTFAPSSFPSHPAAATPAQQRLVAWRLWRANGRSWGANRQWPTSSRLCGVR